MPELPDIQVFARNIQKLFGGKKVFKISVPVAKKLNVPITKLKQSIEGKTLKKVYRSGKELRLEFGNGEILGMHLMLRGQMEIIEEKSEKKSMVFEMMFAGGKGLVLLDPFKQAVVMLNPVESEVPDALSKGVNFAFLKAKLNASKSNIKNFLRDQNNIRGIGNAYSDEIFWEARISPMSIANMIPDNKIKDLVKAIRKVFTWAEKQIMKDHPHQVTRESRDMLRIHNPNKTHSPTGVEIRLKKSGISKTYWTDEQEEYS